MAGEVVFRRRRRLNPFAQISNALLRDERISLDAVGFIAVMVSLPDDWKFNKAWAYQRFNIGREKLDRILKELKAARYATVYQDRDKKTGRVGPVTYVFTDEAGQFDEEDEPQTGKPYSGQENRNTAKPHGGKPAPTNTKKIRILKTTNKRAVAQRPSTAPAETRPAPGQPHPGGVAAPQRATVPAVPEPPPGQPMPAPEPGKFGSAMKRLVASVVTATRPPPREPRYRASQDDVALYRRMGEGLA